ncbi:MAG: BadF/BadG/BcrA/BcrD ATPase family protein [Lactimicrobium sp.]|jgi:N-acetylglucosamine kinase-like BadF-type ATPase|uniref:N-acetylglucosamine kinase n=1 Tax=Lactimicrobium sp. TaxID=2563780 RepID=UPI002F34FF39
MSRYIIGIDGGGTKTIYALADETGKIIQTYAASSISYHEYGIDTIIDRIKAGIRNVCAGADIKENQIRWIAAGIPCNGENSSADKQIKEKLQAYLSCRWILVNDAVIGFYGALGGKAGINVVSGTGSIAYGEDEEGNTARSGGWSDLVGDEGSCAWIGKKGMELFFKEADERVQRGSLYTIVKETYALRNDMDFIPIAEQKIFPNRKETASFQKLVLKAAEQKDTEAQKLYEMAAHELFLMADSVRRQLQFAGDVPVSLTGGLRHASAFVLPSFQKELAAHHMYYQEPMKEPYEGAVILGQQAAGADPASQSGKDSAPPAY